MKTRISFVSNSSSCSFIIEKEYLTEELVKIFLDFNNSEYSKFDQWDFFYNKQYYGDDERKKNLAPFFNEGDLYCGTLMDNGELVKYLEAKEIDVKIYEYVALNCKEEEQEDED